MREHYVILVTTAPALHDSTRELATRLAERANAVLLFLHVVPMRAGDGEGMLHSALDVMQEDTESWLMSLRPSDTGVRFRHHFKVGDPDDVVAHFVDTHEVELVVAEEPPRSWLSEVLWRGLAERLIRRVDCPVVIGGPGFLRSSPPKSPLLASLRLSTVAELLNAMVEARVDALRSWMDHCADSVRRIASSETISTVAASSYLAANPMVAHLELRARAELNEHQHALRAKGWLLVINGKAWGDPSILPVPGPALDDFFQRVREEGKSTSLPLALDDEVERLVILGGARVGAGEADRLLFAFDAEDDFLRILGQPGPLSSFETYAFDIAGLMLSNSCFPEHLHEAGLLPSTGLANPAAFACGRAVERTARALAADEDGQRRHLLPQRLRHPRLSRLPRDVGSRRMALGVLVWVWRGGRGRSRLGFRGPIIVD